MSHARRYVSPALTSMSARQLYRLLPAGLDVLALILTVAASGWFRCLTAPASQPKCDRAAAMRTAATCINAGHSAAGTAHPG